MAENDYRASVLVVDDEASIRESLEMVLEYEGYRVLEAENGAQALERVRAESPDAVLLDIKMPEMDGMEVLRILREEGFDLPVIMITGHGDVSTAVEATRQGAFDFFEKPLQRDRVLLSLRNAVENAILMRENRQLRPASQGLIGSSAAMRMLRQTISRAAPSSATVLITGESGTGKELVAGEIHRQSPRAKKRLVQVNCAAIPEELIESELFGHERGSFTGAVKKQVGKFVAAHEGTIFLDEIGDMSARTQAKVLRVLQNGEVEPVGAERTILVDVRVVAATNKDLEEEVEAGRFREDLFYRLNVVPIRTPPLREHPDDVPALVDFFVRGQESGGGVALRRFSDGALEALQGLPWKGNVRELRNHVERLLILAPGQEIRADDVLGLSGAGSGDLPAGLLTASSLREFQQSSERLYIVRKLEENDWNVTRTAEAIDTPRSNLYKKLDQYGIERPEGA